MLVLDHLALDPDRYQLKFRVIGDTATVTQALITGQIDAAVLPYSFSEMARRTGFHALADAADLKGVFQLTGLCANRDLILRSPDLVTRLIRGIIEAIVFVHDSSNKQDVMQVLRKNLRFEKVEDTETSYRVLRQIVSLDVAPNSEAWGRIQRIVSRVNPKVGQVDLNQLLEGSFARKLEEDGYLPEARKRLRP